MLNYEFPPIGGGGGQAHRALLRQYAGRPDLEVDVLTSAPRPGLFMERLANNVLIFKIGIRKRHLHLWRRREVLEWLFKAGACYRGMIRKGDYDLVHAFFGFPTGWLCWRTARRTPYIVSLRGSDVPGVNARLQLEYKILGPLVFKPIWKKASALVACSEGLKERALRFLPSAGIDVITNGVDLELFHPATPSGDCGPLRLLTVGRLSTTKRLPLLLETVRLLCDRGCQTHLTIVGGGALDSDLRRFLSEKGLQDEVTLAGRREAEDMPEIYRQHDVFVSASMQEGMSNAMLEAMASGLPIVTTRCEGVEELISDNGVVVGEPAAPDLAQAVQGLIEKPQVRKAMAQAARKKAEGFGWNAVADSYLRLYAKVK